MGQFTSSRLKNDFQDPNPWITELEVTRMRMNKMGSDLNEEYLMMHIMNNLLSAYGGLMENLEDKLDCAIEPLTLSVLRDKISEKYEKIKRRHKDTRNTTLVVMTMKRELCLPRPSKENAGNVESFGTRQLTVDLKRRRNPGTQVTRMVEEEMVKEDFKATVTTVVSMGT